MRTATVALVVNYQNQERKENPQLLEVLSDEREISVLEQSVSSGDTAPLAKVHEHREMSAKEEDEFADYVEDLLCKPFLKPEVQEHGIQWLKSRIRIEQYQRNEAEAAQVIADYAFQVFTTDPEKTDFFLSGAAARVRVRVFVVRESSAAEVSSEAA